MAHTKTIKTSISLLVKSALIAKIPCLSIKNLNSDTARYADKISFSIWQYG